MSHLPPTPTKRGTSLGGSNNRLPGGLPPPPPSMMPTSSAPLNNRNITTNKASYATSISKSLTIEEMRNLHQRAMGDAEAKRTELRLVLASRYRELVGSSDEVLKMRERSQELHELVHALPGLLKTLAHEKDEMQTALLSQTTSRTTTATHREESKEAPPLSEEDALVQLRRQISTLPRIVHRALDHHNLHGAALHLMDLFTLLAQQTTAYPLATALSKPTPAGMMTVRQFQDPALQAQMKMTFLHVQTLPDKITRLARQMLESAASHGPLLDQTSGLRTAAVPASASAAIASEDDNTNTIHRMRQPPVFGTQWSAAALSALDMLDNNQGSADNSNNNAIRAARLLDLYFNSKAKLLQSLLAQLHTSSSAAAASAAAAAHNNEQDDDDKVHSSSHNTNTKGAPDNAEEILSKILLILQYDVILHPYQLFVLRNFPVTTNAKANTNGTATTAAAIMDSMPIFDASVVRAKTSHFLAAHLPLLRTKVKSILVSIAGTTASALGQMRQSLYDKTDGADCMALLKDAETNLCTWNDAVASLVDIPTVAAGGGMPVLPPASGTDGDGPRFSLWSALFSNTFSSLVHNILTTSFHSVHTKVISTLRTSLASAPPLEVMRPHEAYRNALKIATDLDQALWNVRKDAHELLVHAEEREESERRLRLSLYVQTCEIMGRLVCELRRMILLTSNNNNNNTKKKTSSDAVQELIVGRLCYLLKFRLTSLPTLLDPLSAPSSAGAVTSAAAPTGGSSGMISLMELQSAFELADDNDDGLITFEEAMEAVDSAFSGTPFHGAEMVRETLLLHSSGVEKSPASGVDLVIPAAPISTGSLDSLNVTGASNVTASAAPVNVTLSELTLLTARGLRHETKGSNSALGTVQLALDDIVENCFQEWAKASLRPALENFSSRVEEFFKVASTTTEAEWHRLYHTSGVAGGGAAVEKVSPSVVGYMLDVCSVLNRTIFPSDSLLPVPSMDYAASLGIVAATNDQVPTMKDTIRWSLVRQSVALVATTYQDAHAEYERLQGLTKEDGTKKYTPAPVSALLQLKTDLSFVDVCFFERLQGGLASKFAQQEAREDVLGKSKSVLIRSLESNESKLQKYPNAAGAARTIPEKHRLVFEATDLFLTSLLGSSEDGTGSDALAAAPIDLGASNSNATPWIHNALPSSRRFALLPVQSDRGLTEMQLRKYGKKNAQENDGDGRDGSAGLGQNLQKGFGFFSNMLRT